MSSFKKFIPVERIVFGTDYPLGGGSAALVAKGLRENALGLLPRLRT